METETQEQKEDIAYTCLSKNQQRIPYTISLDKSTILKIKEAMERDGALNKSRYIESLILSAIN